MSKEGLHSDIPAHVRALQSEARGESQPFQPNPAEQQAAERLGKPPPFPSKRLSKDQIRRFELAQKSVSEMMDQRYQQSVDRILRVREKKQKGTGSSSTD